MVRCRGSANRPRMSDRVEGASVAPAMPSSARAAISCSALREPAASAEAMAKAAAPISSRGRRPTRSPRGAHGDQQPGDQEAVDVHDPQELGGAGCDLRNYLS